MNIRKAFQFGVGGMIGGLLTVTVGLLLFYIEPLGKGLVHLSYNLPFMTRPTISSDEVVLVYIDDASHDKLKQSYLAPWDRALHAKLINRLKAEGARAVVFDVIFSDEMTNNLAADDQLAQAIKAAGNVVLAADFLIESSGNATGSRVQTPHDKFMEGAMNIGLAELGTDEDFIVRRYFAGRPDVLVSSLSWATAEALSMPIAASGNEQDKYAERWLNYYGPPLWLPYKSYYEVVSDDELERRSVPPGFFKNKIVFVGANIFTYLQGQRKDEYRNPYSFWGGGSGSLVKRAFMPGVEVHATAMLNLARGEWLTRLPWRQEQAMILLYGLLFGIALAQLRPFQAGFIGFASMAGTTIASYYVFKWYRIWSPWLIVVAAQIPIAMIWSIIFNSVNLYVQKRLMQQSLSMYVSPSRVKQILKNPTILKPGAEKQEVSILFSDIANFTSFSEGMDSDELATVMNTYFETTVSNCIDPAQGTVVKFIGDAIFAIWNAPERQLNHQELACRGALLLRDSVTSFQFGKPGLVVRTRIGLHAGLANVGNFGSRRRIDYTALGENINLASRMEGLNKYLGTDILVTGEIFSAVTDKFITRHAGRFQLKGFEKAVDVYELISAADQGEPSRAWREAYADALKHYQAGDLDAAEAGFHCVLKMRADDGPSQFFVKHIHELRAHPSSEEWSGIVELKEK